MPFRFGPPTTMIRCQHEDSSLWTPGAAVELSEGESNHLCAVMRAEAYMNYFLAGPRYYISAEL